ncbi:carbohydrate kinase family protein [Labedella endophytica]|nr:PfkB family carbohydrate kinase [Labedella endophytica]
MNASTAGPEVDVVLAGSLFFDMVLTGLSSPPSPGTEVYADGMGSSPGGIANLAVAASRLGLRTALASTFGDDAYGRWCWKVLEEHEGIDLRRSRSLEDWHTAVTVSIAEHGDRSMITHGHDSPISADELLAEPLSAGAAFAELSGMASQGPREEWWRVAAASGTRVFADVGWDATGVWDTATLDPLSSCYAFTPNMVEAMAYTRTDSPLAAARSLSARVPLVVVTCGEDGAIAIDSSTGEEARVPRVPVTLLDATGAGDVFAASFVLGTLREWPLAQRLSFSALCSALAVQQFGGSLASPGWGDIADWWSRNRADGDRELSSRYRFLDDVLPSDPAAVVRRADATFHWPDDVVVEPIGRDTQTPSAPPTRSEGNHSHE